MTRYIKSGTKIALILLTLAPGLWAQDLYDLDHSRQFARYLMVTQQYKLAAGEWERVLFLNPADSAARINLLKSYRFSGQPEVGWHKLNSWHPEGPLPNDLALEAIQCTYLLGDFQSFRFVLERSPGLSPVEIGDYILGAYLLEGRWADKKLREPASSLLTIGTNPQLQNLLNKTETIRQKSPAGAVALSALVPGLGKVYSNSWKDGLFSLVFVGTNVWQSYRGFSQKGIESVTGWIFGALAAGFYTANLFGSWKTAKEYNQTQIDRIHHEAEHILITR